MNRISAIDRTSVARICSGQVVTDLATAVKELVENSLDARARHVEVKLRDSGLEMIEVADNGAGVAPEDGSGLALKYHTSKLRSFDDLRSVVSFGFRGEALSSLCELAGSFVVVTRTAGEDVGRRLTYNRSGSLLNTEAAPRQVGTTVCIGALFEPLPVRRAELQRGIKRQFNRLLRSLQAYALISVGVRITVTNVRPDGKKQVMLATQTNSGLGDNVANVFGAKFLTTLAPFEAAAPPLPALGTASGMRSRKRKRAGGGGGGSGWGDQGRRNREGNGKAVAAAAEDADLQIGAVAAAASNEGGDEVAGVADADGERSDATSDFDEDDVNEEEVNDAGDDKGRDGSKGDGGDDGSNGNGRGNGGASEKSGGDSAVAIAAAEAAGTAASGAPRRVWGLVSRAGVGAGRSDADRQFFYLNGRPVELPRLARCLNETWRHFEPKQASRPACVVAVEVSTGGFDVNMTPDKREVALVDESAIVDVLAAALTTLWAPSRHTFVVEEAADRGGGLQTTLAGFITTGASPAERKSAAPERGARMEEEELAFGAADDVGDWKEEARGGASSCCGGGGSGASGQISAAGGDGDDGSRQTGAGRQRSSAEGLLTGFACPREVDAPGGNNGSGLRSGSGKHGASGPAAATVAAAGGPASTAVEPCEIDEEGDVPFGAAAAGSHSNGGDGGSSGDIGGGILSPASGERGRSEARRLTPEGTFNAPEPRVAAAAALAEVAAATTAAASMLPPLAKTAALEGDSTSLYRDGGGDDGSGGGTGSEASSEGGSSGGQVGCAAPLGFVSLVTAARRGDTGTGGEKAGRGAEPSLFARFAAGATPADFAVETAAAPAAETAAAMSPAPGSSPAGTGVQSPLSPSSPSPPPSSPLLDEEFPSSGAGAAAEASSLPPAHAASKPGAAPGSPALQPPPPKLDFDVASMAARCCLAAGRKRRRAEALAAVAAMPALRGALPDEEAGPDAKDTEAAARAFSRVLSKRHFREMSVVGQFNLGFIITQLGSDLFIMDQHACDEKHNFEALQRTTIMHQQPLVRPMALDMSAAEEMTVLEHLPVFEKNGFRFDIDDDALPGKKLKLAAVPFSKGTQFGAEDVRELASILVEDHGGGPGGDLANLRLPKARAMFASRACRKSVMIGTALDHGRMRRLVAQMADVDQPWNCPHGRPTMRHLTDLVGHRRDGGGNGADGGGGSGDSGGLDGSGDCGGEKGSS